MSPRPIIPAHTAIETFRDSGYKNTAAAVAELIDNSIEAGAKDIQILTFEEPHQVGSRETYKIKELCVYDNGEGMDKKTLGLSLQFGVGTRMRSREGIGRFGIGLPNASVSQCKRVDIYSWRRGRCYWTYLDIDEVKADKLQDARPVEEADLPEDYFEFIDGEPGSSGTLVVWSKCDRLDLQRSSTLFRRMQNDLCRVYRHFLDSDDSYGVRRRICLVTTARGTKTLELRANDPLYMLTPNNTPGHEEQATNVAHGNVQKLKVKYLNPETGRKKTSTVEIRYSIALPEVQRLGGNSPLGQHYRENTGISFMRAGREIDFGVVGFFNDRDERHRWWGCEVRFEPVLDELFGVTNNKQSVRGVRFIDEVLWKKENPDWKDRLEEDERLALNLELSRSIGQNIRSMMKTIEGRGKNTRGGSPAEQVKPDMSTLIASGRLSKSKAKTQTREESKGMSRSEKVKAWQQEIQKSHPDLSKKEVEEAAKTKSELEVEKVFDSWPGAQFFSRERVGETCILTINQRHPFYKEMYDELLKIDDARYITALDLLMFSYIRMEDELYSHIDDLETMRETWGRHLRDFLNDLKKEA